jgi:hypothetical protein
MARGFESKAVADQQESAQYTPPPADEDGPGLDPQLLAQRRRLELSRADVTRRLLVAHVPAHREILARALSALDEQIAHLR